jgi:hypothetical protein
MLKDFAEDSAVMPQKKLDDCDGVATLWALWILGQIKAGPR